MTFQNLLNTKKGIQTNKILLRHINGIKISLKLIKFLYRVWAKGIKFIYERCCESRKFLDF